MKKYVVCINNEGVEASLDIKKVYEVIQDELAEKTGMIRVIDNSGEDYLHSSIRFVPQKNRYENKWNKGKTVILEDGNSIYYPTPEEDAEIKQLIKEIEEEEPINFSDYKIRKVGKNYYMKKKKNRKEL